ncbi:MAG: 50S ribosomal protein L9 [Paracoccaceae bacterium]|nr:50S ribosomal protein L9 [Paracoccaceae bacterium]MDE2914866.1 50S ribosomal protein L9 [Paracoccaceae bacterium]
MDVILLQRVPKLGQMGDVVSVKKGYARNFLLPKGRALRATDTNLRYFETEKARIEAQNLEQSQEAEAVAKRLEGQLFVVIRSASDSGSLYGSVTSRDIAQAALEGGFEIDRSQCVLDRPIKELGMRDVTISLHPEVQCSVVVNVARSEAEAELQAAGRDVGDVVAEEEQKADAEMADLFDDLGAAAVETLGEDIESDDTAS